MKATVHLIDCTLSDSTNTSPITVSGATIKSGAGQMFRYKSTVTFSGIASVADIVVVPAWTPPAHPHVLTFLGVELLTLSGATGGSAISAVNVKSGPSGLNLVRSTSGWGTFPYTANSSGKQWATMAGDIGTDTGVTGTDHYFPANGAHFIGVDSSYHDGLTTMQVTIQAGVAWTGAGSFNLHAAGFFLG